MNSAVAQNDNALAGLRARLGWPLLAIIFTINAAFSIATLHVFHTPAYTRTGHLRDLLVAACLLNVLATGLVVLFRWSWRWRKRFEPVLAGQCFVSLLPFVLVRALRIPNSDHRLHVIGAVYALFIYLHLALLLIFALSHGRRAGKSDSSDLSLCVWMFASSLLIYGAITPWADVACLPTADEPHYLLLTHSLVFDHDFDLANNYANGDYRRFYPPEIPRQDHHTVVNARRQEVPVHDVGISILLVPGYALAGRLGAMLESNFFGAVLALGIFWLGYELAANRQAAMAAWALFAFSSPVVVYTSQIYPEIVGAALAVWAMVAFLRYTEGLQLRYLLAVGSGLALLPWYSIRYWLIAGPMLAVVSLYLILAGFPKSSLLKALAILILPLVVSVCAFAAFDWHWYRTLIPNAGYVLLLRPRPSLFNPHLLPGLPGLLFDRAFGLLTTAPVYLLAIAGALVLCRRKPWLGAVIVLPVVAYILLAALNKFWYGGWAPPPRYIVTGVAIMAPLAAIVLSRSLSRWLLALLATWSCFIAIAYTAFPLTRYTYWKVNSGALSDFLAGSIGVRFGEMFPSLIRAAQFDYLLCAVWGALALAGLWLIIRAAPGRQEMTPGRYHGFKAARTY